LHRLEHSLAAPVAFIIVPLFGFANAGVDLTGVTLTDLLSPLPLGIALGLFLGKQLGIFAAVWLAVRTGFAARPRGATWRQIHGVAVLCGVGFTMSLFIGALAFADARLGEQARLGTLIGSLLSALLGYTLLRLAPLHPDHIRAQKDERHAIDSDGDVGASLQPPIAAGATP
jgi:NhaA family Na+:H+ antiporter